MKYLKWWSSTCWHNPGDQTGSEISETALSLGIVIFAYLLATSEQRETRVPLGLLFGSYALLDIWRLVSYIALGDRVLYEGAYVLTDPLIYVPWIMLVWLVFYAFLLLRLNRLSTRSV